MFRRTLFSTLAVATLVTAVPVLANTPAKDGDAQKLSACCEQAAMHLREHGRLTDATEKQEVTQERTAPRVDDDPFVQNQSWGG